jgi:hypothetical protein
MNPRLSRAGKWLRARIYAHHHRRRLRVRRLSKTRAIIDAAD